MHNMGKVYDKVDAQFTSIYPNLKMKNEELAQYNMYINALSDGIKNNFVYRNTHNSYKICYNDKRHGRNGA